MRKYKCLSKQEYTRGLFKLVSIRDEDKLQILKMRNEQIYHLRQAEELTIELQDTYFTNVISSLFDQERPNQILFSLLEDGEFVGYGGLVHINWIDMNAEISFIMKTELEKDKFEYNWTNYLTLLEKIAFKDLRLHKIFTYAFDLRQHLYPVLEASGFNEEARLKEHCYFDGKYLDVVINSKINNYA
jgi:RimJ/RimL family protein N-acetyltransferase